MFKGAIQHKGFALVDVFSPCVTYNQDNTYAWFNPRVKMLEEQGHDPSDLHKAIDSGYQWGDEIPIGLFWTAQTCRHWKSWSPCCIPVKARWPFAKPAFLRSRRKRW